MILKHYLTHLPVVDLPVLFIMCYLGLSRSTPCSSLVPLGLAIESGYPLSHSFHLLDALLLGSGELESLSDK